jgi:hypothetical protein
LQQDHDPKRFSGKNNRSPTTAASADKIRQAAADD